MSLDNLGAGDYSTFAFEISALVRMNLLIVVKTLGAGASPLQEVGAGLGRRISEIYTKTYLKDFES